MNFKLSWNSAARDGSFLPKSQPRVSGFFTEMQESLQIPRYPSSGLLTKKIGFYSIPKIIDVGHFLFDSSRNFFDVVSPSFKLLLFMDKTFLLDLKLEVERAKSF